MAKMLEALPPEENEATLPTAELVKRQPAMQHVARRIVELVEEKGLTEEKVAGEVCPIPWGTLMRRDDFVGAITEIRARYGAIGDEEQRELIKAGWTKQMVDGLLSDDPVVKKLGQDASKLLAPQVGLQQQPQVQVGVQIGGDLAPLLKDADVGSVVREDGADD